MSSFSQEYDSLNNLGVKLISEGNYDQAINIFTKAISINPQGDEAYANLANVFDDLGKQEKAIEFYNKAISINPKNVNHYFNLGVIYKNLSDKKLDDPNDSMKPYYISQGADNRDNATINFLKAAYYDDLESKSILNKIEINVNTHESIINKLLEIANNQKMKYEEYQSAKDIFSFILNNEQYNQSAMLGTSVCYYQLGLECDSNLEFEKALQLFNYARKFCSDLININPNNGDATNLLGHSYYAAACVLVNLNKHTKAIEYFNQAKLLVKTQPEIVLELLSKAYFYDEQNEMAQETLRKLSSFRGKIEQSFFNEIKKTQYYKFLFRGNNYDLDCEWEKAIEYYDKAINLFPSKQDAYYNKGKCYEHKGDLSKALFTFEQAIKIDPEGQYSSTINHDIENIKLKFDKSKFDDSDFDNADPDDIYIIK
jgi:tetratricopeptide (TPR) repeat protein